MWSALVIPTFLFLSCFSVGSAQIPGSVTHGNDRYPPFWDQINGDIAEFPVQDNKIIIDLWKYKDRLQIYKILIRESNKYFVQFGKNDTGNVLWGLTLLYGKLYKTGRFVKPSNSSVCAYEGEFPGCISIDSGWGGFNFYVLTIYFLAAIESGFLRNISQEIVFLSPEEHRSYFCYSIEECRASFPQAMDTAKKFYQYLQSRKILSIVGGTPVYNTDKDTAILYMWDAHQALIDIGKPMFNDIFQYSSATERDFTFNFLLAIEFCAAAIYRSFFESSAEFLVGFPHRPLTDEDDPILPSDFNIREKALMSSVKLISNINQMTGGSFLTVWKKAMNVSKITQFLGRLVIKNLLLIPNT
ncbi:protein LEG1 homolog [Marmota marmota marmota]|uniref:Protein LEG1 homolog n=1 Tax=Marmota marmota marmota TaxID=9994 RepID=A0A8C5ZRJ3_MARMA|nr:protein LEG1 homolog [Marmota marmota marmota]